MLQSIHGYSETFWNLFSKTPTINFRTLQTWREGGGERYRDRDRERELRSINLSTFTVRSTPSYAVESNPLYLFKQKVNKPSSAFNRLERGVGTVPLHPARYLTPKFPAVEYAIPLSVVFAPRVFRNHNEVPSLKGKLFNSISARVPFCRRGSSIR